MLSPRGFSAYQTVFGSNPADLCMRRDDDSDLEFAQNATISGQFPLRWELVATANEAARKEIAESRLRRLLDHNRSLGRAGVLAADAVSHHKMVGRRGAPKWRRPAVVLHVDEAGVAATFQGQTSKVARYCARERAGPTDVGRTDWHPVSESSDEMEP